VRDSRGRKRPVAAIDFQPNGIHNGDPNARRSGVAAARHREF
jgi:hypothetical protein